MKNLVTNKQARLLQKLLMLAPQQEVTFSYDELLGYLYGIAITPDLIQPSEWIPVIFDHDMSEFDSEEQSLHLMENLFSVLNRHIAGFQKETLVMPFDFAKLEDDEIFMVLEWTSGFEEALALRPEIWEDPMGLSDEEREHLMNSLVVIEGLVNADEAAEMFHHIPKRDLFEMGLAIPRDETERGMYVQAFLLQALEVSVQTIQQIGFKYEQKRRQIIHNSVSPIDEVTSDPDSNEPCPCGSGELFGHCCGNPDNGNRGERKKGQVIKVDFPDHGRKRKKTELLKIEPGAVRDDRGYQLEITLAYTDPEIRRIVEVPGSMTLGDLHKVIQVAMGWQDMHLHQYQVGLKFYGPEMADDYTGEKMLDEERIHLVDLEHDLLQGVVYTYDFGDDWQHIIILERVIPGSETKPYPVMTAAERACPPEDIGGINMFRLFLDYLENQENEELKEVFDTPSLRGFQPEHVNPEEINGVLRRIYEEK